MAHLLFTGFKACGKTTIGRLVAARLGRRFVDLDEVIEEIHAGEGERLPFRGIYESVGPEAFRELEYEAACLTAERAAEAERHDRALVVALGGGSLTQPRTRDLLTTVGLLVYIRVPLEEMLRRVRENGYPAFLKSSDPENEFAGVFREREPLYLEHAELVVDVADRLPEEATAFVLAQLKDLRGIEP
ncbi:hypothetical protein HQ520_10510 [bacterium]|nr:hypothetical protein [bacterium]